MSHWQLLDLTSDADERSIKRAYARLLKNHRPDENPDAFQRLREAYETALAEARWRAQVDEEVVDAPLAVSAPTVDHSPLVSPLERIDTPIVVSPPEPSLEQMKQGLAEGKERQVMDALRQWLTSDWLLPFEHREQFEQSVLDWLESAEQWSPAFFEGVCQAMGWDETRGDLPCDYWRWDRLIRRCEMQAMEESVRRDLNRFDAEKIHGQAAALLLKPMSDSRRRGLADYFTSLDWQRFAQIAQSIDYQYPELPQRLGLKPLDNWRDWLPPESFRGVYLFLWLALSVVVMPSLFADTAKKGGLADLFVMPLFMPVVIWLGMKAYQVWYRVAVSAGGLDVQLSRGLLPRRWYRQGAGLLMLRHILPSAVPAALSSFWSSHVPWMQWVSPVVVFLGTLYFTNMALCGGKVSIWARALQTIRHKVGGLISQVLQRESILVVIAILVSGVIAYARMRPGL
ncbi:J domain-containing protein [Pseudomonas extremaustralis]|uniref:J domain-containing protein n=1 Tax=Pseudomonas extremaustralis TaxID=359110 RepID=UPI002AA75901|nr:J domain-containing protein [Pseudomonas extremaustralis]